MQKRDRSRYFQRQQKRKEKRSVHRDTTDGRQQTVAEDRFSCSGLHAGGAVRPQVATTYRSSSHQDHRLLFPTGVRLVSGVRPASVRPCSLSLVFLLVPIGVRLVSGVRPASGVRPSVRLSVRAPSCVRRPSVRQSVRPSVRPSVRAPPPASQISQTSQT